MNDHAEIHDLLARYAWGLDARDFALVARCFAPDARATYGGQELEGVDAIVRYVRAVERFRATTHVMTNIVIDLAGDRASVRSQAIAYLVSSESEPDAVRIRGIRYDDEMARIEGRWVITARVHRADWASTLSPGQVQVPPER